MQSDSNGRQQFHGFGPRQNGLHVFTGKRAVGNGRNLRVLGEKQHGVLQLGADLISPQNPSSMDAACDDYASACSSLSPRKSPRSSNEYSAVESPLRTIHAHTAHGHFIVNSVIATPSPVQGLKYKLAEGRASMDIYIR